MFMLYVPSEGAFRVAAPPELSASMGELKLEIREVGLFEVGRVCARIGSFTSAEETAAFKDSGSSTETSLFDSEKGQRSAFYGAAANSPRSSPESASSSRMND